MITVFIIRADYSKGFGGKFGVQKDRQDKVALGWDEKEALAKHESQKGFMFLACIQRLLSAATSRP